MSHITIMFVAPLSSDHQGFSRYRSLLLILLYIKGVILLDCTFSRLQLITDFFVPLPSWILQYILLSKVDFEMEIISFFLTHDQNTLLLVRILELLQSSNLRYI